MAIKDNLKGGSNLTFIARAESKLSTIAGWHDLTISGAFPSTNPEDYILIIEQINVNYVAPKNQEEKAGALQTIPNIKSVTSDKMIIDSASYDAFNGTMAVSIYANFAIYYKG